jgi:crotonobetainyl-CoA:carnitine CoA-transferase CaiB-like acyl-CoA transferase
VISIGSSADDRIKSDSAYSIFLQLDDWQTEETLFASSGVSHLLGDPDRPPLTPAANYAAHTIGYSIFAAVASIATMHRRYGDADNALIHGDGVMSWVNWKTAIYAENEIVLKRQGDSAEWPIVECKDGFVAFLYTRWEFVLELIDDDALRSPEFEIFEKRAANRDGYMSIIRRWCSERSKNEIAQEFEKVGLPGAPALTIPDLMEDALLAHRKAFRNAQSGGLDLEPPHRVVGEVQNPKPAEHKKADKVALPLEGFRILDFGIITAGAGVSALLADMGAEVIKIESHTRPDPFRKWPGANNNAGASPVFKCNNRNKYGVAIDLKTPQGKAAFLELAQTADVVLENFRRGVLDRLGLSFEALSEANPSILLASISSQGVDGPGTRHPTFGSTLEASSGFSSLTTYEDRRPYVSGRNLNYPDQIVCLYGAAIVAAYAVDCHLSGAARHVDISQRDTALFQIGDVIGYVAREGRHDVSDIRTATGRPLLSDVFLCSDGAYAALSADDSSIATRIESLASLDSADVAAWAQQETAASAVAAFINAGGGGSRVRDGRDLLVDPALRDQMIFTTGPNGALVKGFPFLLENTPMTIWGNAPEIGEHTERFLGRASSSS